MYQQSYLHSKPNNLQSENSFTKKYLPKNVTRIPNQQSSLLYTPENYLFMVNYSTSLQQQNEALKQELHSIKKELNDLKCNKRENFESRSKVPQRCLTQRNANEVTFESAKMQAPFFGKNLETQEIVKGSNFVEDVNDEIILFLKEENQRLYHQVHSFYKQKEKKSQNGLSKDANAGQGRLGNKTMKQEFSQTFDKIRLSLNQQQGKESKKLQGKSKIQQSLKLYNSQPNSFEISFQVPPSFKSLQDLPKFTIRNNTNN